MNGVVDVLVTDLLTMLVPLAPKAPPADEDVTAGWVALFLLLLLGGALVFLFFSLRKHLGRVNFEEQEAPPKPKPPTAT